MNCLIALFLSLDCIVINIKNPVISFYRNDKQNHQRGMWVSCSRPSAGLRMHNRCCASAYQLLCKRTTAVVRPTEPTSSITNTIFSDNFIRLFRQLLPYSAIVSYACVHLLKLFMCRKNLLGMSVFHKNRLSHHAMTQP